MLTKNTAAMIGGPKLLAAQEQDCARVRTVMVRILMVGTVMVRILIVGTTWT